MSMHFLFPTNPLRASEVDGIFEAQMTAARESGYSVSLCPESVIQESKALRNIPSGASVVYRGWMLNECEYMRIADAVNVASAKLLTSPAAYLATHHLPNWYPLISDLTPETHIISKTSNLEVELRALGWREFFIKDFVKSLKTTRGSIVRDPSEISSVVAEMERFRGEIEGGLCIRRVESFISESERRYFVLDGNAFSSDGQPVPAIVRQVAERIQSPFFSVDVIRRDDGVLRVVEVGDGQVSDLVGWSEASFVAVWLAMRPIITDKNI